MNDNKFYRSLKMKGKSNLTIGDLYLLMTIGEITLRTLIRVTKDEKRMGFSKSETRAKNLKALRLAVRRVKQTLENA